MASQREAGYVGGAHWAPPTYLFMAVFNLILLLPLGMFIRIHGRKPGATVPELEPLGAGT